MAAEVYLTTTPELDALRSELRTYFAGLVTPEVRTQMRSEGASKGPVWRRILRQMGTDGWLGIGWPVEYGGQGRGPGAQFVFFDEAYRAEAPLPLVTLNTVGPTLMKFGTEEQKRTFLQPILAGELVFAIGYTEPGAGTDLASLRTRAERDGDEWVINGNKVFTSGADSADWVWLATRTDPDAPKHKGISMIMVPTSNPGFSVTPIVTVRGEETTTATYYDDVHVPVENLVGEVNAGWRLITNQLNHERVALAALSGVAEETYDQVVAWAAETTTPDGGRVIDSAPVQTRLAEAYARLAALRLLNWRLVDDTAAGTLNPGDASAVKVYGSEGAIAIYRLLQEVVGSRGLIREGSAGAVLDGVLEMMNRAAQINTFGGGVNEVQREIVAWVRLGMKRGAR